MKAGRKIAEFSTRHPVLVTLLMAGATLSLVLLAALPTVWPERFAPLHSLHIDTDPENMLPEDEPVRAFHSRMKREMSLYDMVVVGIVNEEDPNGVFNPDSLRKIYELTVFAKGLRWPNPEDPSKKEGVLGIDVIAPSTVDNIEQGEQPGFVKFEWLMPEPPTTEQDAIAVRDKARQIPFLNGTLVSEDGQAICLYLPLTSKDLSSRVYDALNTEIAELGGPEQFHITGLPVAEDVFGVEMFQQMAISAPLAMLVIFLLMLLFFRKMVLILSPMIVAVVCVLMTMGLLVVSGHTVHIMSSMIPIFIMPIAVLDAVHILSEFFDRYQETRDRRRTITHVIDVLFAPMLYTSLTTAVGFGSLALVPIPPVQVFGLFVAFGVLMAWVWTITFIPAYVMFVRPQSLENFGVTREENRNSSLLSRALSRTGTLAYRHARAVLVVVALLVGVAVYGVTTIRINDNPIKWFTKHHPIRVADRVLNRHFGGTYMAYLALQADENNQPLNEYAEELLARMRDEKNADSGIPHAAETFAALEKEAMKILPEVDATEAFLSGLERYADDKLFSAPEDRYDAWDRSLEWLAEEKGRDAVFKQPEILDVVARLQQRLESCDVVGKTHSVVDIVKTVRRELVSGKPEDFRIPDSASGVAQTLLQYQNGHRPQDLWHFVTPDYRTTVLWVQLRSGDNRDMSKVIDVVDDFMSRNGSPSGLALRHRWFGLTYINVIWQQKMVKGMLQAFLGSFLIVFLMMTVLYCSALWGFLSMLPLSVSIALIYGVIGLLGKDYDMPVAVLSALSLGLAVDYAIHFLSRSRTLYEENGSWKATVGRVFSEPARAISRNAIVIGVGFLPLLAAPLVPYRTVGMFIAAILFTAGLASLVILPSIITLLEKALFPRTRKCCLVCNCVTCIVSGAAIVAVLALSVYRYVNVGWTTMSWVSVGVVSLLAVACIAAGRLRRWRRQFADGVDTREVPDGERINNRGE